MENIQMAKALGLSPKTLMKNQPVPSQQWKLPVKLWIRGLHAKRFGSSAKAVNHPVQAAPPAHPAKPNDVDADVPF
jgi:pyrroloquinoline quinone (PQQ) biosynthesis protein C